MSDQPPEPQVELKACPFCDGERDAIVAWLRKVGGPIADAYADFIERGDHLTQPTEGKSGG